LLQNARYRLDNNKQPKPASKNHDVMLFDTSPGAKQEQLLLDLYKDLFGVIPSSDLDFSSKIVVRIKSKHEIDKRLIYYLITPDYLDILTKRVVA